MRRPALGQRKKPSLTYGVLCATALKWINRRKVYPPLGTNLLPRIQFFQLDRAFIRWI